MKRIDEIEAKGFFKAILEYFEKSNLFTKIIERLIIIEDIEELKYK
jgi:hypothetical protein